MLKSRNMRRTIAMAATSLAIAGGTAVGTAGTANAAAASCSIILIGSPGNVYVGSTYAGQVEQEYDNCGNAAAHFQWSGNFYPNGSATATVNIRSTNGTGSIGESVNIPVSWGKDITTPFVPIHSATQDTWYASVSVNGGPCAAGSFHDYATGGNSAPAYCSVSY